MQISCFSLIKRIRMHVLDAQYKDAFIDVSDDCWFWFFTLHYHTCNLVPLLQLSMDVVCMCGFV